MSVLIELATQALTQAEEMNKAAKHAAWEEVSNLQIAHTDLISKLAATTIPPEQAQKIRELLEAVKRLNAETEQLAEQNKSDLVKEKQTFNKANKMQKALDAFK